MEMNLKLLEYMLGKIILLTTIKYLLLKGQQMIVKYLLLKGQQMIVFHLNQVRV
jgi:hypothetical protein